MSFHPDQTEPEDSATEPNIDDIFGIDYNLAEEAPSDQPNLAAFQYHGNPLFLSDRSCILPMTEDCVQIQPGNVMGLLSWSSSNIKDLPC